MKKIIIPSIILSGLITTGIIFKDDIMKMFNNVVKATGDTEDFGIPDEDTGSSQSSNKYNIKIVYGDRSVLSALTDAISFGYSTLSKNDSYTAILISPTGKDNYKRVMYFHTHNKGVSGSNDIYLDVHIYNVHTEQWENFTVKQNTHDYWYDSITHYTTDTDFITADKTIKLYNTWVLFTAYAMGNSRISYLMRELKEKYFQNVNW